MASDNAAFVDTENTKVPPDGEGMKEAADAAGQISTPSETDGANASTPSAPAQTNDKSQGSQDRSEETGEDIAEVDRRVTAPEVDSETTVKKRKGATVNGTGAHGNESETAKAVNETNVHENDSHTVKTVNGTSVRRNKTENESETAKALNGKGLIAGTEKGSVFNGTTPDGADRKGVMGKGDGDACERSGGGDKGPVYPPGEAKRALRNAIGVGVVFMVHFTATLGVTHLQSSVNKERGLGTSALAAQYAGLVLSSLALSVFIISKLGCKWTMVVAIACNVPYMAAQMHPRVYTLVPAAFLMGLAVAPLWSAKCTYLCVVAEARSAITGRALPAVRDQIIGLFFMVFLLSMVWGNLVSSLVLSHGGSGSTSNASLSGLCGVAFCPNSEAANDNPNLERPPQEKIILIIGIYIGFMLLAALVAACFVDSLKRYSEGARASSATGLSTRGLLTATLGLHRRKEMLLLVPLSVWLGVDYAFIEAEYTASFVACAWGIQNIGYVIIAYGAANSALALCTGWIVARAGRRPVLCAAAVLHAALMAATLAWRPNADHPALFFVVAVVWGAADGHWAVQLNSLYAILFPHMEEAAYSNFRLWQSIGFVIAFSYSHYLCTAYKLYIVMGLLGVGVAGYLGIEYTRPPKARLLDG